MNNTITLIKEEEEVLKEQVNWEGIEEKLTYTESFTLPSKVFHLSKSEINLLKFLKEPIKGVKRLFDKLENLFDRFKKPYIMEEVILNYPSFYVIKQLQEDKLKVDSTIAFWYPNLAREYVKYDLPVPQLETVFYQALDNSRYNKSIKRKAMNFLKELDLAINSNKYGDISFNALLGKHATSDFWAFQWVI